MSEVRNVIIIGSGPAGYTAGLYAGRAMLNPLMFAGYMSGGQLMLTSDIENFPGYPEGIAGPEMMMQQQMQQPSPASVVRVEPPKRGRTDKE